ncbi:hypothetical protein GCM10025790_23910 [Nesterenkonia rhizosphaerae]|uniref:Uncharacterized protein n=1 Tax=Nesterenkonia rhizosphaerae TaxID=1348272 RepID=A0ABP9G199_9MICC
MKNIANSPAKNISSLVSHTMVPTDTMFGRFGSVRAGTLGAWVAVVTETLCPEMRPLCHRTAGVWRNHRSLS